MIQDETASKRDEVKSSALRSFGHVIVAEMAAVGFMMVVEEIQKVVGMVEVAEGVSRRCTYGSGAIAVVSPAKSSVAPTVPRARYICPANSGNAAAKAVRIVVLHASALAASGRYATTM